LSAQMSCKNSVSFRLFHYPLLGSVWTIFPVTLTTRNLIDSSFSSCKDLVNNPKEDYGHTGQATM
jgi:hypothetical protein